MGVVVAQQRKAFLAAVPQHAAQDAWQALQRAALNHSSTFNGACWPEEVGPNTAQLHGALPRDDRSQSLVDPADPGPVEDNSTQDTARLAAEQKPHLHREVLHAWQSLSRVPLEGTVLEELACARCGGLSRSHAAPRASPAAQSARHAGVPLLFLLLVDCRHARVWQCAERSRLCAGPQWCIACA